MSTDQELWKVPTEYPPAKTYISFGPHDTDEMSLPLAEKFLTICKREHPTWFATLMLKIHDLPNPSGQRGPKAKP